MNGCESALAYENRRKSSSCDGSSCAISPARLFALPSGAPPLRTETSELSQNFTHKQLDALPNIDRNPLYQMNLMPGANNGRGSGNYGVNGGENGSAIGNSRNQIASLGGVDANANSVFVEGTFNREPQNAYVGVVPPIEAIEEVQVYTGKYNAEYGFSGSAVVNVVTRSGTNDFHGSAFEYLRNTAPDAKPFFSQTKTPFQRNQFGGAFGGPVRKNKLFSLRIIRELISTPQAPALRACLRTRCIRATSPSCTIRPGGTRQETRMVRSTTHSPERSMQKGTSRPSSHFPATSFLQADSIRFPRR